MRYRGVLVLAAVVVLAPFAVKLQGCGTDPTGPSLDEMFASPVGVTWAFTSDGSHLWTGDLRDDEILRVDASGNVVAAIAAPGAGCGALAWDGSHLWMHDYVDISSWPKAVTLYRMTTTGEIVASFPCPVGAPRDMAWDGSGLWIYSYRGKWYKVGPDGEILASIDPPWYKGPNSGGAWDDRYLCCVIHPGRLAAGERRWSELYRIDSTGAVVDSARFMDLQFWGLAYAGGDYWVVGCPRGGDCVVARISYP